MGTRRNYHFCETISSEHNKKKKNRHTHAVKLASKVIRARSESYAESDDASYASEANSNDSSESSTASAVSKSSSSSSVTSANTPAKCSITRVTIPRKIVIKYTATIESPVLKPPLAIIGQTNSLASDVSDFSESSHEEVDEDGEEDGEEEEVEDEESEDETEQSNDLLQSEEDEESEEETASSEDETETGSVESDAADEDSTIQNGFASNGTKKSKGYDMDDFKILKTIGE